MTNLSPLDRTPILPELAPCEHIAGNEKFILKGFQLQERHLSLNGESLIDLTLDLEDGAPVGNEANLRVAFARLIKSPNNTKKQVGVRIHPPDSPHCALDIEALVTQAGSELRYITIPKVKSVREVTWCAGLIKHYSKKTGQNNSIALHLLIETSEALTCLSDLAAIPEVVTLDFGLMDFISQLGGAVASNCMQSPGQFSNELLRCVKSDISLAALRAHKIPSHNVTVDIHNPDRAYQDALKARTEFGYLRMWSIHPNQIEPIIRAMTPAKEEIEEAQAILAQAQAANWGPINFNGRLHDRASFRYYQAILNRAQANQC